MPDYPNPLLLPDTQSRYEIKTRTANGEWDQVVAVSQDIVNANLEEMFKVYEADMKYLYFESDVLGRIDAELEPSRIIIPSGASGMNTTTLLYQIRFKSGQLFTAHGQLSIEDLSDFVISFPVELGQFSDDPAKTPSDMNSYTLETQQQITKSLRETIKLEDKPLPTDYSIERLYTKLSSASFKDPDKETSFWGKDEKGFPIPFNKWTSENFESYSLLRNWLEKWAIDQDINGRNVFGFSVQLTEEKAKQKKATYESRDMVYQTYAYKNKDVVNGKTGLGGYGGRNCLLYCEMTAASIQVSEQTQQMKVLRSRPASLPLIWSGNFATMPSSDTAKDGINGTFLLNREVILGSFLLPNFCKLNQASEVYHTAPYAKPDGLRHWCWTPYLTCSDERHADSSNPVYAFSNENKLSPNEPEKPALYRWEKINRRPENGENGGWIYFHHPDPYGSDIRVQSYDKMSTEISWQPGSSTIKIEGKIDMEVNMQWATAQVENDWVMDNLWAYSMTNWTGGWSMTATFVTDTGVNQNGVMDVKIDAGPNGDGNYHLDIVGESKRKNMQTPDYSAEIRDAIKVRFKDVVSAITADIKHKLAGSGAFTFPGSGVFSFKNPILTRWGDLAAQIDYLPLPVEKRMILIPGQVKPVNPGPPPRRVTEPQASPVAGQFALTWTRTPTAEQRFEGRKRNKLVWRGTNLRDRMVTFREIRIIFTSRPANETHLFREENFYLEGKEPKRKEEPTEPAKPKVEDEPTVKPKAGDEPIVKPKAGDEPTVKPKAGDESTIKPEEESNMQTKAAPINPETGNDQMKPLTAISGAPQQPVAPEPTSSPSVLSDIANAAKSVVNKGADLLDSISGRKKAEPEYGIVRLRQHVKGSTATVALIPQSKSLTAKQWKWTTTIDDKSGVVRLEPNEWVEVEFEGLVGEKGSFVVTIEESYETGKPVWKQDFTIVVAPPTPKSD